jgi:hypothetical protein
MGNSSSQNANNLICKSDDFKSLLEILVDAHEVSLYYAELLLQDSLPIALQHYKNYSKVTEAYFNTTRQVKLEDIDMSYHDFYNQLAYLNYMYEAPVNNGSMRRNMILQVFDKSYKIQKHLIQEIYGNCVNIQN